MSAMQQRLMWTAYGFAIIAVIGILVGFVEGARATYIKIMVEVPPSFPQDREPTEEERRERRKLSRELKWTPYSIARERGNYGLLVGFLSLLVGIIIVIIAGKCAEKETPQSVPDSKQS
jgi:hypothetical protein